MRVYKQTTDFTCGPSSLLMVLNHYYPKKFKLTQENEFRLWLKTIRAPLPGTSIFALAKIAQDNGIKTKIIVGRVKYSFPTYKQWGIKKKWVNTAVKICNLYYLDAKKAGVKIEQRKLGFDEIKDFVKHNDFIILRVDIKALVRSFNKHGTHYIVISDFKGGKYLVFDPLVGKYYCTEEKLKKAFENVPKKCGEDNRVIIFNKNSK